MDEPPRHPASGLRAIFLAERPTLLRLLTIRLGSAPEAEDALQDIWLKLGDAPSGPIASPAAYLFRMAHNAALDRRRSALAQSLREARWLEMQPGAAERPDAEAALLASERLRHVEAALAALPERVATAFRMFRIEGRSQKSIAQELGLSLSSLEKLLQRAYREIADAGRENDAGRPRRHRLDSKERLR